MELLRLINSNKPVRRDLKILPRCAFHSQREEREREREREREKSDNHGINIIQTRDESDSRTPIVSQVSINVIIEDSFRIEK